MSRARRALVCQHRFPEHDRERGSKRVLDVMLALRAHGWDVTFVCTDPEGAPRYERDLRRLGVPCRTGWSDSDAGWVRAAGFDLAIVGFWHVAEQVLDDLRSWSPTTTVVVDSIDLHFVREARRRVAGGRNTPFDEVYGDLTSRELEVYRRADAVLCVSDEETHLLDQLLGAPTAHTLPLAESTPVSSIPVTERRGLLFVGNFRHRPNLEALRWLHDDVLPVLGDDVLARHPLRVVGHAVDDAVRELCDRPGIELVGWVPSVEPDLHRARVTVVPLRHGAGVKGKTLQSLMAGTPVVSTPIGVEGIELPDDLATLVTADPHRFAAAIVSLVEDDDRWMAAAASSLVAAEPFAAERIANELAVLVDEVTRIDGARSGPASELAAAIPPGEAAPPVDAVAGTSPAISVLIATHDRADLLDRCLASLSRQTVPVDAVEVVVVDDGSTDSTPDVVSHWADRMRMVHRRIAHRGRSAAKNAAIELATGHVLLLLDDDEEATPELCERHVEAHLRHPRQGDVVLGHTRWAPDLDVTPFMHHVTDVGQQLFSYPSVPADRPLDWRHFWEGRLSIKRALADAARSHGVGLHDERLAYTIDIEWAYRLSRMTDLAVHYEPDAVNQMTRPVSLDDFCARARAKGRAQWQIASIHTSDEMRSYCGLGLLDSWPELAATIDGDRADVEALESAAASGQHLGEEDDERLAARYRRLITAHTAWGLAEARADDEGRPAASVIVPVWSVTPELAEVARDTVDRVRDVAERSTEIVVIDNGSPFGPPPDADVLLRNPTNLGVAPAWNQGIRLARGEVVIVLNSDCRPDPGFDRALRHAALDGRRIAFPYTDHGDGQGSRAPDQAGTAGWCFALHRDLADELGPFDCGFAPAFFEDTDYWHRAWELGVELSPVPAARVAHQRRTTARHLDGMDDLFTRNRRRYEAKHGLVHDARPPFWDRTVVEYPPPAVVRLVGTPDAFGVDDPDRPRVFGIGLSKTGTSSLHAALAHLGFRSVHHGSDELRDAIAAAIAGGHPPLAAVDPTLDAFCDVPQVVDHVAALDQAYPGSRFILTVRDPADLVASHVRHAERNRALRDAGAAHGTLLEVDPDELCARAAAHHAAVTELFADRPGQLLVLDICAGDGWERLAPFLGWERCPERDFPWENCAEHSVTIEHSTTTEEEADRVAVP